MKRLRLPRRSTVLGLLLVLVIVTGWLANRSRSFSEQLTIRLTPITSYQLMLASQKGWIDVSILAVPRLRMMAEGERRFVYAKSDANIPSSMGSVQNRVLGRGIRLPWVGILIVGMGLVIAIIFRSNQRGKRKRPKSRRKR